jgi:hypothetical protein
MLCFETPGLVGTQGFEHGAPASLAGTRRQVACPVGMLEHLNE